jgi:hypothetical protein
MNSLSIKKCFFIAAAIALFAVFMAVPAGAGGWERMLSGKYSLNTTGTCVAAVFGFDANTEPGPGRNAGPGVSYGYAVRGEISFYGHGKFEFIGKYLGTMTEPYGGDPLTLSNFNSPVHAVDEMKCSGSYLVDHDGKELVAELTFDSCKFIFPTLGVKEAKGGVLRGRLDTATGATLVFLTNTTPTPEDMVGYPSPVMQRICTAYGSMVKLSSERERCLKK